MTEWYSEYLERVGTTETIKDRVDELYEIYHELCPEEITGVVITEFITEEGLREYESLWFFSASYAMEAKLFITQDMFDMALLRNAVARWEVKKQDYDLNQAGDRSRLHVGFRLANDLRGSLKASRENCDHLWQVFKTYILPNMQLN